MHMQVTIGYSKPRSVVLTPSRTKLGRILARGSKASLIRECLNDEYLRKLVVSQIGGILYNEIRELCSNKFGSIMKSKPEAVRKYSSDKIIEEMQSCAPVLLQLLRMCTQTRRRKRELLRKSSASKIPLIKRQNSIIATCVSVLCKYRCPSMSLLQKVISVILYAGNTPKMVSMYWLSWSTVYIIPL